MATLVVSLVNPERLQKQLEMANNLFTRGILTEHSETKVSKLL